MVTHARGEKKYIQQQRGGCLLCAIVDSFIYTYGTSSFIACVPEYHTVLPPPTFGVSKPHGPRVFATTNNDDDNDDDGRTQMDALFLSLAFHRI